MKEIQAKKYSEREKNEKYRNRKILDTFKPQNSLIEGRTDRETKK